MKLTGIILAGGKSSRMGQDKGLMEFQGKPMIQYSIDVLNVFTNKVIISSNNDEYSRLGYPVISDIYKDCGPLGGLHAALRSSTTDWNIIVSCDAPFLTSELFHLMLMQVNQQDAIIPNHEKGLEPLFGIYNRRMVSFFEEKIKARELKILKVLKERNIEYFDTSEIVKRSPSLFSNINSPGDLYVF